MFTAVDNHSGNTPNSSRTIERQDMLNHLFNDVIQKNVKMGREIKNIIAPNGKKIKNITPSGWGSVAHISVDGESGDIKNIERVPTKEDQLYMQNYLEFLEKSFEENDGKLATVEEEKPSEEQGPSMYTNYRSQIETKLNENLKK